MKKFKLHASLCHDYEREPHMFKTSHYHSYDRHDDGEDEAITYYYVKVFGLPEPFPQDQEHCIFKIAYEHPRAAYKDLPAREGFVISAVYSTLAGPKTDDPDFERVREINILKQNPEETWDDIILFMHYIALAVENDYHRGSPRPGEPREHFTIPENRLWRDLPFRKQQRLTMMWKWFKPGKTKEESYKRLLDMIAERNIIDEVEPVSKKSKTYKLSWPDRYDNQGKEECWACKSDATLDDWKLFEC